MGACATVWSGCTGAKVSELVAGVSSQVQVPRDIAQIVVTVNSQLGQTFCQAYPVYDGKVRLPRTLGVVSDGGDPAAPITITVAGFDNATIVNTQSNLGAINCLADATVGAVDNNGPNDGSGARVLRRSRQPYVPDKIIYVPMPLHYSCFDISCVTSGVANCEAGDCTCVGGICTPPDVDSTKFPDYDDNLVFGTSDTCFRPFTDTDATGTKLPGCMDDGIPPQVVDEANCIYVIPGTPSAAGLPNYTGIPGVSQGQIDTLEQGKNGLNVRTVFDNVVSEVLDYEGTCPAAGSQSGGPVEGYCTFADNPQRFMLAPGLCADIQSCTGAFPAAACSGPPANAPAAPAHTITLMTASGLCASKTAYQPICDDSVQGPPQPVLADGGTSADGGCNVQTVLTPAPSALYMLFDKSSGTRDFFGAAGASQALGLSLDNPVFKETDVAFEYTPAQSSDCTSTPPAGNSYTVPGTANGGVAFANSLIAQPLIGASLASYAEPDGGFPTDLPPGTNPWYLEAAFDGSYQGLINHAAAQKQASNRLAVMLFMNRDFGVNAVDCAAGQTCAPVDCGGSHLDPIQEAQAYYASNGIETYVVMLKNADDTADGGGGIPPQQAIQHASQLAQPRTLNANGDLAFFFDATGSDFESVEVKALGTVISDLGSCVYESAPNIGTGAQVSFLDLTNGATVTANYSPAPAGCTGDSDTTPLWVYDSQHIRLCPTTCNHLVTVQAEVQEVTLAQNLSNAQNGLPPVASVQVTVTAQEPCNPATPDPPIKEAGVPLTISEADGSTSSLPTADSGSSGSEGDASFGGIDAASSD